MKSPPVQIHDDIARQRVEAFIRGEDNETLKGTEEAEARIYRKMSDVKGTKVVAEGAAPAKA